MNILIDPLPEIVEIDGQAWPVNSGFFIGVLFELLMQDRTLTDEERVTQALALYYPEIPSNLAAAMDRMLWFYSCGKVGRDGFSAGSGGGKPQKKTQKAYCFEQDADLIFAAFWGAYGIDLNQIEGLHWWKFRALFAALPAECEFCKVLGYRAADTKGLPKKQKQFYDRMKQLHALRNEINVEAALTLAERNQGMKDYVSRRFAEAESTHGG